MNASNDDCGSAPRRFSIRHLALPLALILTATPVALHGTSVKAPDFDSLVKQAEYVVRGTVKSVRSEWEGESQRVIVTFVEMEVAETIAGTPPSPLVLRLLGGTVDGETLTVEGAPTFREGEEHIVFVRDNGRAFYPLVGVMHGQYPIRKDRMAGKKFVARCNGAPLRKETDVSLPLQPLIGPLAAAAQAPGATAMTPADFSMRIRQSRLKPSFK